MPLGTSETKPLKFTQDQGRQLPSSRGAMSAARTLLSGFIRSAAADGTAAALWLDGQTTTYGELAAHAAQLAHQLESETRDEATPAVTAVLGRRSVAVYAGILASLSRGHAYVPLNPGFPTDRCRDMLTRSKARFLIVDAEGASQLVELLSPVEDPITVIVDGDADVCGLQNDLPHHNICAYAEDPNEGRALADSPATPESMAYLLFTSGTSGTPKGVMVSHDNVTHFVQSMVERYDFSAADRFSQMFDLTFDLSVFDMFVAWEVGACLCVPTAQQKMLPGAYVRASNLTVWFSVPSTAALMARLRMLKPDAFPSVRISLFCGEALTSDIVNRWQVAAPSSVIENLYGPTELTIACTGYRWHPDSSPESCEIGLVPIGEAFPGLSSLVVDEGLHEVEAGGIGELLVAGPQVALGYWMDEVRTAKAFVVPAASDQIHYRTGDRVRRPATPDAPLTYLGRVDNQIKIQGYRVELGEVEFEIRRASGASTAVAIGWPQTPSGADGIVAFVGPKSVDVGAALSSLRSSLPSYMTVSRLIPLDEFPLNANGKIDRGALAQSLQEEI